jgi:hypothetical protein
MVGDPTMHQGRRGMAMRTGSVRVPKKRSLGSWVAVAVLVFVIVVSVVALSLYLQ